MDTLWAIIVILLILFLLFVILPSLLPAPKQHVNHVIRGNQMTTVPSTPPSAHEIQQMEAAKSKAMLDQQYQSARSVVPEDHPRQPIGACPYSKPPSTDLPLGNVPMCMAVQPDNMHLRTPPLAIST